MFVSHSTQNQLIISCRPIFITRGGLYCSKSRLIILAVFLNLGSIMSYSLRFSPIFFEQVPLALPHPQRKEKEKEEEENNIHVYSFTFLLYCVDVHRPYHRYLMIIV